MIDMTIIQIIMWITTHWKINKYIIQKIKEKKMPLQ